MEVKNASSFEVRARCGLDPDLQQVSALPVDSVVHLYNGVALDSLAGVLGVLQETVQGGAQAVGYHTIISAKKADSAFSEATENRTNLAWLNGGESSKLRKSS